VALVGLEVQDGAVPVSVGKAELVVVLLEVLQGVCVTDMPLELVVAPEAWLLVALEVKAVVEPEARPAVLRRRAAAASVNSVLAVLEV